MGFVTAGRPKLRPVRHRTDPKVRAHVTLCMLALFLQRTLEQALKAAGIPLSAVAALEQLETCHLNQMHLANHKLFHLTTLTPDQRAMLAALEMADLEPSDGRATL